MIEVWPVVSPDPVEPPEVWNMPFDARRTGRPEARLAERMAALIRQWVDNGEMLNGRGRAISYGDVMILVARRMPFAPAMIRALKNAGIPVAGADRMVLTDHIAAMDLMALGRFVWLSEDDLNLAALMKSPLVGLGEEDLIALAPERKGSLWQALRDDNDPLRAEAAARLDAWRRRGAGLRPYEFFAGVLGADGGRERFHARLGAEAFDALDEFLSLALDYEHDEAASISGFITWLEQAPGTDQARHGSGTRRGSRHDRAWRKGAGSADRVLARYLPGAREKPGRPHSGNRRRLLHAGPGRPCLAACKRGDAGARRRSPRGQPARR